MEEEPTFLKESTPFEAANTAMATEAHRNVSTHKREKTIKFYVAQKRKRSSNSSHIQKPTQHEKDAREIELEKMLFGDKNVIDHLGKELQHSTFSQLGDLKSLISEETKSDSEHSTDDEEQKKRKKRRLEDVDMTPAWEDEDDNNLIVNVVKAYRLRKLRSTKEETQLTGKAYSEQLRRQFERLNRGKSEWAIAALRNPQPNTVEALRSTAPLIKKNPQKIEPRKIAIGRMKDANVQAISKAVVQSVRFHPNGQLLLTASLDRHLHLFQIDSKDNEKVQSIYFADLPLTCAAFTPNGTEVIVSGTKKHFYVYDIVAGKVDKVESIIGHEKLKLKKFVISPDNKFLIFLGNDGYIVILSNKTKQCIGNLKMNGRVTAATFSPDGRFLYTGGANSLGEIYQWDIGMRRCVRKFTDEGAITNTALHISSVTNGSSYLAVGSDSGIVNIYDICDRNFQISTVPKPLKVIKNLTTSINNCLFNFDAQLLAISSMEKRNALRLVHLPSFVVYENWPKEKTPLSRVSTLDFHPDSSYLAIGNIRGKVPLFKLYHYHQKEE
jgi:U3 small nucleolar RNA-associated protein 18